MPFWLATAFMAVFAWTRIQALSDEFREYDHEQKAIILDRLVDTQYKDNSPRLDINASSLPSAWKEAHPRLANSEITCRCSETFDCFAPERSPQRLPESEYTVVLELEDFPDYHISTADDRNGFDDRCMDHGLMIAWQATQEPITMELWHDIVDSVGLIMSNCAYSHNGLNIATGQSFESSSGLVTQPVSSTTDLTERIDSSDLFQPAHEFAARFVDTSENPAYTSLAKRASKRWAHGDIRCPSPFVSSPTAGFHKALKELREKEGRPSLGKAGKYPTCVYLCYKDGTQISWCNKDKKKTKTLEGWNSVAEGIEVILKASKCNKVEKGVKVTGGAVYHPTNWYVFAGKCWPDGKKV
ncbi:hypothetical protein LIA77_11349 [Sarocladium implicatum]|nr:hypothetical protein LIA77_11349 [Sarocladium implicatum]